MRYPPSHAADRVIVKAILVSVNGKKLCLAGRAGEWPLWAQLHLWDNPENGKDELSVCARGDDDLGVWALADVHVGDEVVIRIVDADEVDAPMHYVPALPENRGPFHD